MGDEQVDWVGLEEVIAAADRGLAPLGPEFAGFVVLEAATRVRDVGGGTLRASDVVVDGNGQVHLTQPPRRADESRATSALRALLQRLLEVATSSTPALRACARKREAGSFASLVRELEGALIPLNRAASRRGVARVAKATLDAIDAGQLQVNTVHKNESSEPPPAADPTPSPNATVTMEEATPCTAPGHWVHPMGEPPPVAVSPVPPPPVVEQVLERPMHRAIEALEDIAHDDGESIEIVSNLPPIVDLSATGAVRREDTPRGGFAVSLSDATKSAATDRVDALLAGFQVSRLRDDPALSRDLKAMIGIETSMPPAVAPRHAMRTPFTNSDSTPSVEVPVDAPEMDPDPTPITYAPRKRGGRALAFVSFAALGFALFAAARSDRGRAVIAKWLSPASPPPGDAAAVKIAAPATTTTAPAPKIPTTCEARLDLLGVPKGAEVARRLGTSPLSVAVTMHAPIDLVATSPGSAPRRAHVEPSAAWQDDPTGPRLDLPLTLDVGDETKWPAATNASLAAPTNGAKGMLRVTTNPSGATLWMITESPGISGLPCGAPIELRVAAPNAPPRVVHVEWSAFTGAPPHATFQL